MTRLSTVLPVSSVGSSFLEPRAEKDALSMAGWGAGSAGVDQGRPVWPWAEGRALSLPLWADVLQAPALTRSHTPRSSPSIECVRLAQALIEFFVFESHPWTARHRLHSQGLSSRS